MLLNEYVPALKYGAKILSSEVYSGIDDFSTVRYVDGVNGSDKNLGLQPAQAFATIQAAINASSAYDTIYIRPKYPLQGVNQGQPNTYAENLTIGITKTGLKLIGMPGLSDPYFGPKIKPATGATTAVITVHASSVVLENLCIMNLTTSVAGVFLSWMGATYNSASTDASHLLYAGSCGAQIRNCEFREGTTTATGGASIVIRGGYNSTIENCTFVAGANAQAIQMGDDQVPGRNHKVINCNFHDNNGAVATVWYVDSGVIKGQLVRGCTFGLATKMMTFIDGSTGVCKDCGFADGSTATVANSTGKIEIPTGNDEWGFVNCHGGGNALIAQAGN